MTLHQRQLAYAALEMSNDDEYYVFPYDEENEVTHNSSGFCDDMTCPCHEDNESISDLNQAVQDGEASPDDANRIYRGQTVI
jgi:hypothetical protein